MKSIIQEKMCVTAKPGASITICIDEAIVLAIQQDVVVGLIHNDSEFIIDLDEIRAKIRGMAS